MSRQKLAPWPDELPGNFAERLGIEYAASVTAEHKKQRGQFFTPLPIGRFMASLLEWPAQPEVQVLDPGCGTALLACCAIERLADAPASLQQLTVVVFETDPEVLPFAVQALDYAKQWANGQGVAVHYRVDTADFVLEHGHLLAAQQPQWFQPAARKPFDVIVTNPPYFKLNKQDPRAKAAAAVVDGQPNIYALFLSITAELLVSQGQLISITPRSFAAGRYFRAFRHHFFERLQLSHVHLFASRREAFERDRVLQETLIMRLLRGAPQLPVAVSESAGTRDLADRRIDVRPVQELIDRTTPEWMLYLPAGEEDKEVIRQFRQWPDTLATLGLRISTGPVVAFRTRPYLHAEAGPHRVPLIWMHNVRPMLLQWPNPKPGKEQFIEDAPDTRSLLRPNQVCVLLRRFSAKDDKSRLVAAPYLPPADTENQVVGFENKVNYLYRATGKMPVEEAIGLAALLNSKLFDTYFRTFNGNINVSATELRGMPLPPLETIRALGRQLLLQPSSEPEEVIFEALGINAPVNE